MTSCSIRVAFGANTHKRENFPSLDLAPTIDDLRVSVQRLSSNLRPALQNAVIFVGNSLGAQLDARGVFDDDAARRVLIERLRRDVWMFAQLVRAFAVKAKAVGENDTELWPEFLRSHLFASF